jgi:hypothetical protein
MVVVLFPYCTLNKFETHQRPSEFISTLGLNKVKKSLQQKMIIKIEHIPR